MKNLLLTCVSVLALYFTAQAQDYQSAVGLRLGLPVSVSYKTFITEQGAIEAFAGYRSYGLGYNWFNVGAAYQHHTSIDDVVENLSWYWGAGGSLFFYSFDNDFADGSDFSTTVLGVQGYIGLDYKFEDAPVNISLDWVPTIILSGFGNGFGGDFFALSARYVFNE